MLLDRILAGFVASSATLVMDFEMINTATGILLVPEVASKVAPFCAFTIIWKVPVESGKIT